MDDRMCQCGHYESDHGADGSCESSASTGYCPCFIFDDSAPPDPRDAEIARLKAQIDDDNRVILAVREHNRQLRAALAYAADRRGTQFDFDEWLPMVVAALGREPAPLPPHTNPRAEKAEAEIARLNMRVAQLTSGSEAANLAGRVVEQDREIVRLRRALAAGPAALRAKYAGYKGGIVKGAYDQSADLVERAQADAMKEEP